MFSIKMKWFSTNWLFRLVLSFVIISLKFTFYIHVHWILLKIIESTSMFCLIYKWTNRILISYQNLLLIVTLITLLWTERINHHSRLYLCFIQITNTDEFICMNIYIKICQSFFFFSNWFIIKTKLSLLIIS